MIVQVIITALIVFKFAIGSAIGSFLNVAALRYSSTGSGRAGWNVRGRSRCPYCGQFLSWYELVPLLSFLFQSGRCRSCGKKLSWQYPIAEILGGLIAIFLPLGWWIPAYILLLTSLIDFRLKIIPDSLIIILAGWGVIEGVLTGGIGRLVDNLSASILSALFFVLIIIGTQIMTKNSGMGWGDVKLGAALGLWLGLPGIFYALVSAFILGAIFGVILLITKQKGRKDAIPFGPFLAIGAILAQSNFF